MPVIELEQNTPEWLEFRRSHIGASEIPIILSLSPYSTPLRLWKKKLGFEQEQPSHPGMTYGLENESEVRALAQQHFNMRFDPVVIQHDEIEWATASLDGWNPKKRTLIEIKCPNENDHALAKKGKVPEKYFPQVQWQMFVSGFRRAYYCSFRNGEVVFLAVPYNENFIERTLVKAEDFYKSLVNYTPPEETERDYIQMDDPEFGVAAVRWMEVKEVLDEARKQEREARDRLADLTDDGNCEGFGIRMTRVNQKGSIDWEKVCIDYEIDVSELDKYRKPQIGFWKIAVVK